MSKHLLVVLVATLGLAGCMAPVTAVDVLGTLGNVAANGAIDTALSNKSTCGGQVKCGGDAVRALAEQRRDAARDRDTVAYEREWTNVARTAAHAGDCATVVSIERRLIAIDDDGIDGGFHDAVFLRYPEILDCLAAQRARRPPAVQLAGQPL